MRFQVAWAFVVLSASAASYAEDRCGALDYQELKDMNIPTLSKEYCKARKFEGEHNQRKDLQSQMGTTMRDAGFPKEAAAHYGRANEESEQEAECRTQAERISRVLQQKGVEQMKFEGMCKADAS